MNSIRTKKETTGYIIVFTHVIKNAIFRPFKLTFSESKMPDANNANGAADSAIKSAKCVKITGELIILSTNGKQINKLIIKGFLRWFRSLKGFPSREEFTTSSHTVLNVNDKQSMAIAPRIGNVAIGSKMKLEMGSTNRTWFENEHAIPIKIACAMFNLNAKRAIEKPRP